MLALSVTWLDQSRSRMNDGLVQPESRRQHRGHQLGATAGLTARKQEAQSAWWYSCLV